ncbi:MAG: hypothetical protein R6W90_04330 [Ignavibacteriaceae bacterium]
MGPEAYQEYLKERWRPMKTYIIPRRVPYYYDPITGKQICEKEEE